MTQILLVGSDEPLLEGLAQSFAALGHVPRLAVSVAEAVEASMLVPPLVAVIDRKLVTDSGGEAFTISLAPGGALVLYRGVGAESAPLPYSVQRQVLADLTLPLERNRLVALIQHVQDRAVVTGRGRAREPRDRLSP